MEVWNLIALAAILTTGAAGYFAWRGSGHWWNGATAVVCVGGVIMISPILPAIIVEMVSDIDNRVAFMESVSGWSHAAVITAFWIAAYYVRRKAH